MNKISYGKEHDLVYGNYKVIIKRGYRYSTKIALPVIIQKKKMSWYSLKIKVHAKFMNVSGNTFYYMYELKYVLLVLTT